MRIKVLLIAISLTGCLSQNKLAQKCAERFPVQEQIKEVIVFDTIYTKGDTIKMGFKDTSFAFICPPNKTIIKTKEVKITAENTAKTYLLKQGHQKEMAECKNQIADMQRIIDSKNKEIDKMNEKLDSVKKYKHRFYIILLGIILYFVGKFSLRKWLSLL